MIRRGEKDCGLQGMGDVLMRSKLLSVVERDRVHEVRNGLEAAHGCFLGCAGGRTGQLGDFGQFGFALDQREQAAFVSGTDNGVALPVSQTGFARDMVGRSECRFYWGSCRVRRSYRHICYNVFRVAVDSATSRRRRVCPARSSGRCIHGSG